LPWHWQQSSHPRVSSLLDYRDKDREH
jgi:hypothetical protein